MPSEDLQRPSIIPLPTPSIPRPLTPYLDSPIDTLDNLGSTPNTAGVFERMCTRKEEAARQRRLLEGVVFKRGDELALCHARRGPPRGRDRGLAQEGMSCGYKRLGKVESNEEGLKRKTLDVREESGQ